VHHSEPCPIWASRYGLLLDCLIIVTTLRRISSSAWGELADFVVRSTSTLVLRSPWLTACATAVILVNGL